MVWWCWYYLLHFHVRKLRLREAKEHPIVTQPGSIRVGVALGPSWVHNLGVSTPCFIFPSGTFSIRWGFGGSREEWSAVFTLTFISTFSFFFIMFFLITKGICVQVWLLNPVLFLRHSIASVPGGVPEPEKDRKVTWTVPLSPVGTLLTITSDRNPTVTG